MSDSYPAAQTTVENVPLTFSSQKNNALSAANMTNDVGLSVPNGKLTLSTTNGLTFINGTTNASNPVEFSGTVAAMNAALNGLVFTPPTNFTGSDPLTFITAVTPLDLITVFTTNTIPIAVTPAPPTVATPAAATPSPVTGATAALSVLGADDAGESSLTYTWATTGTPPAAVAFSANGTNAAKNTTATFSKPGTYNFQVTLTDAAELSTTSSVSVLVNQTLTTIAVSPSTASLNENQTRQFSAIGYDQFGNVLSIQPTLTWSLGSGVGSVNSTGLYTAPYGTGSANVMASSGSVSGSASITVTNAPPTVATAAAASPDTVTGASTALSVLGADDGGESNLTYSWSVLSKPAGAAVPSFSLNGSNVAQNTTATFWQAGTYVLEAVITDAGGLSTSSSVSVTVDQTFTSIAVSPASTSLAAGGTQPYTAAALDQFGIGMAVQPSFTWGATNGVIDSSGLYTAPPTSGPDTVTASSGGINGSTTVTIVGNNTAVASPSSVTGNSTTLSVVGGATSGITYTWSTLTQPSGAADPIFSANASSAAQTTTATFFAAGNYTFQVAIVSGVTTTQSVAVTVEQTLTSIVVSPATSSLNENGQQSFSAVGFDQFDQAMLIQPSLSWAVTSGGGAIDGSGLYTAAGSGGAGSATISAISGSILGSGSITVTDAAPTIATAASAGPSTVSGSTTFLSVLGADDGGESNLTYTWSTVGTPPAPVVFSVNTSNSAKDTTATFTKAGGYQFLVTITDVEGLSVTSSVSVTVDQTLTSLALLPASPTVTEGNSQQFSATATDQFGDVMATPSLVWSIQSGAGSIDGTGLYTAASTSGTTIVSASNGGVSGAATITVPNEPPTIASAAGALPSPAADTSAMLNVLGADDGGESNLTYTWSTTGTPPAPVQFSVNDSNAAKNTIAHFTTAGVYQFLVTITDTEGLTVTSSVNVTVNQTLTNLALSPPSATVAEGTSEQFSAAATDQFGNPMVAPPLTWSVQSGTGSIDSTGLYTASATSGSAAVSASSGAVTSTATITIPNEPPTVAIAAAASPKSVTGTSTSLSVLGADDGGESTLTYTWSTIGTPPATAEFSANDSNAAKNTIAHFTKAGVYQFLVTITDSQGLSVTSGVNVTVNQTLTKLALSLPSASLAEGTNEQISAAAKDQFGNPMPAPPLTWSVLSGAGSIDGTGLFTAATNSGATTVSVSSGAVSSTATITVPNEPPTVAIAAAASSNPVTGTSTSLSVLGADDGGESNLTYTWSATGTPPAPVLFSANGTNAAKDVTAAFAAAGTYDLLVSITDAQGATASSSARVVVDPVLTSVRMTPARPSSGRAQTAQFSAAGYDQFGVLLASQPAFTWSVVGNVGSIDSSGLFTAPTAGNGLVTVVAATGHVSGMDSLNLIDDLAASAPTSVSASTGVALLFTGGDAVTISDGDPDTASVPVTITVAAQNGTITLGETSGLNVVNGAENNSTQATFSGSVSDVNRALGGMTYTSDAGFVGTGSIAVTIDEVGTNPPPSYPIAIKVGTPAVSPTGGGSDGPFGPGPSGDPGLDSILNTSPINTAQSPDAPPTYSGGVIPTMPFGGIVIVARISNPTGSTAHPAQTPAPTPTPFSPNPIDSTPKPAPSVDTTPANALAVATPAAPTVPMPTKPAVATPAKPSITIPDIRVQSVPEQVFSFLGSSSEMSRELDQADDKLVSEHKLKIVAGSATVASFSASAAYLLWMLRGGSLLSSLLSILPAWRTIDPLPVLDNFESRKRRKSRTKSDVESLESMVDKSNSDADPGDANGEDSAQDASATERS